MRTKASKSSGSLKEWSDFLKSLSNTKSSGLPLLRKAQVPQRLVTHLENKLASSAFEFA